MRNTINKRTPLYLQALLIFTFKENVYSLRDSDNKLTVPRLRTEYLKRSFSHSGALLLNGLSGFMLYPCLIFLLLKGFEVFCTNNLDSHTAISQNSCISQL